MPAQPQGVDAISAARALALKAAPLLQGMQRMGSSTACWSTSCGRRSRCTGASGGTPARTSTPSLPETFHPWSCLPSSILRYAYKSYTTPAITRNLLQFPLPYSGPILKRLLYAIYR